mgnify:CR=1 FL=1
MWGCATITGLLMRISARFIRSTLVAAGVLATTLLSGCAWDYSDVADAPFTAPRPTPRVPELKAERAHLIAAARAQVGRTVIYDPKYVELSFPGGDIPLERGVCTDVVVRAFRDAGDQDLQLLLHYDMVSSFSAYPTRWGEPEPDPNIDHRRTENLEVYLTRIGARRPVPEDPRDFRPGDLVTWRISGAEPHIGIVSDRIDEASGRPLVIHNVASGTVEEDFLWVKGVVGRFVPNLPTQRRRDVLPTSALFSVD